MSTKKITIDAKFSERLRHLIEDILHIKREEFREKIGISQGYLGMVLIGKRGPSAELIAGLFNHYRGYLHWILTGEGNPIDESIKINPGQSYALGEPIFAYGSDRQNIGPAVDLLANILNSGDRVIITALMSNLQAFNQVVEKDLTQTKRVQELEEKCQALEKRLEILELKQLDIKSQAA